MWFLLVLFPWFDCGDISVYGCRLIGLYMILILTALKILIMNLKITRKTQTNKKKKKNLKKSKSNKGKKTTLSRIVTWHLILSINFDSACLCWKVYFNTFHNIITRLLRSFCAVKVCIEIYYATECWYKIYLVNRHFPIISNKTKQCETYFCYNVNNNTISTGSVKKCNGN